MIDKSVLKRLLIQNNLEFLDEINGNSCWSENGYKNLMNFANACAEYGKTQCAAKEFKKYPDNNSVIGD